MLKQESDMWARDMEREAEQRRKDASDVAQMRRREKLTQRDTKPLGQWQVMQGNVGSVTIYDYEPLLLGHTSPNTVTFYRRDIEQMVELMAQATMTGGSR